MTSPTPDRVFEALTRVLVPRSDAGLVDVRRAGDQAVPPPLGLGSSGALPRTYVG